MNRHARVISFAATALVAACQAGLGTPTTTPTATPTAAPTRTPDPFYVDVCGDIAKSDHPVTAGAATDSAGTLNTRHAENRITLPASGSANAGFVKFSSDKEGPWEILLTQDVPFKLTTATGAAITPSAAKSAFPDCAALEAQYTVDIKLGVHYIQLGPTSGGEVSVVTENGEEE